MRRQRSRSFGAVAEDYERYRLGYPEALALRIEEYAGAPLLTALEVGAGTGKATRLLAGRGVAVTAVEPDPAMAAVLAREVAGLPVEVVVGTFEEQRGQGSYDLLFSAAAWHWTDPATRWSRAAGLLRTGGVLAVFGAQARVADPAIDAEVDAIEEETLAPVERAEQTGPAADGTADGAAAEAAQPIARWSVEELAATDGFVDAVEETLPRTLVVTAEEVVGRLGTVSAYLLLEPDARADALRRVRDLLPDRVELDASISLLLGRRRPRA